MARRPPGVISQGTARQLAELPDAAYSANGESQFSRQSASTPNIRTQSYAPRQQRADQKKTPEALLKFQRSALAKLRYDLSMAKDATKRAKIAKNIGIKSRFIATLEKAASPRAEITTLPGADEADWS